MMNEPLPIEIVRIDDLTLDMANARERTPENRSAIRASLSRFGAARSIVVDSRNIVRAGNGTVESAAQEGITEVLVVDPKPNQLIAVRRREWSDTEAMAYAIADNRAAELATWDEQILAATLEAVRNDESIPVESVGFTDAEVDELLEKLASDAAGDDEEEGGDGDAEDVPIKYELVISCKSESHQRRLFERLTGEGESCRVLSL